MPLLAFHPELLSSVVDSLHPHPATQVNAITPGIAAHPLFFRLQYQHHPHGPHVVAQADDYMRRGTPRQQRRAIVQPWRVRTFSPCCQRWLALSVCRQRSRRSSCWYMLSRADGGRYCQFDAASTNHQATAQQPEQTPQLLGHGANTTGTILTILSGDHRRDGQTQRSSLNKSV